MAPRLGQWALVATSMGVGKMPAKLRLKGLTSIVAAGRALTLAAVTDISERKLFEKQRITNAVQLRDKNAMLEMAERMSDLAH